MCDTLNWNVRVCGSDSPFKESSNRHAALNSRVVSGGFYQRSYCNYSCTEYFVNIFYLWYFNSVPVENKAAIIKTKARQKHSFTFIHWKISHQLTLPWRRMRGRGRTFGAKYNSTYCDVDGESTGCLYKRLWCISLVELWTDAVELFAVYKHQMV